MAVVDLKAADAALIVQPMEEEHLRSLLLARGLLDRARAAVNGTGPGAMAAVVLFDLAVESAGKTALGSAVPHEITSQALLKKLDEAARTRHPGSNGLAGLGQATKLRKLRNGVQHDGNEPSARDVERAGVWAEEFIDELAKCFFDRSLRDLSRASLISDREARASVSAAENLAADGEYSAAAGHLGIAFEQAQAAFRDREPWRQRLRASRSQIETMFEGLARKRAQPSRRGDLEKLLKAIPAKGVSTFVYRDVVDAVFPPKPIETKPLRKLLENVVSEIVRIDQRLEGIAVAGDPGEYAWFRQRVPRPSAYAAERSIQYTTFEPEPPFTQQDYLRALDFVLAAAVRWQQTPAELTEVVAGDGGGDPVSAVPASASPEPDS